ncbi:MAG: zinc-ribbon domain-containing protein [Spirochaetia bacterium]|nr:zinc-ribbon domain-containing protein [Spirochaetia bacterium]MCI6365016.1 zinc-ribbon domain-containing protein [Spirochaetia bacterium]
MYCSNCGKDISDAAKFCPLCGSPQSASQQTKSESESVVIDGENAEVFNFHEWIVQNGLESYEELLKTQDLNTLDVLMTLTESDLEKIGIESIGAKKKIINGIQKLKTSASTFSATQEISEKESIPNRCPNCGNIWGMENETSGAGNTLGKALVGGLLLGPLGVIGGAAFGNKTVTYICKKCGFKKDYKSSIVKTAARGVKNIFK